jgi:hypothetical protein
VQNDYLHAALKSEMFTDDERAFKKAAPSLRKEIK